MMKAAGLALGHTEPQRKDQNMKDIMIIAVVAGMMAGCGESPPPVAAEPPDAKPAPVQPAIEEIARAFAMEKVTPTLYAPATADYPIATVKLDKAPPFENLKGETIERWRVRGGVDAHNLNGAFIRNEWRVTLIRNGDTFKPVEVELKGATVFIDSDYEAVFLVQAMQQRRAADKAEAARIARAVDEMRARLLTIDDDIEKHEQALAELPERPAGGTVFAKVESHRKEIERLKFQKQLIQARLAEVDQDGNR